MPQHERHPTPLLNMSPSALPGLGVVALMFLGMWSLFEEYFLIGLAIMSFVALVSAFLIRGWRAKHPAVKDLLHLDSEPRSGKGADE
jgi:hypothetical protein